MARGCSLVSKAPRSIDRAQSHTTERTFLPGQAEGKYRSIWSRITVEGDFTNTSRSPCYHLSRSGDCSRIAVPPCHLPFAPTVVIGPICPDSVNCESVGLTLSTPNTLKPAVPVLSLAAGRALQLGRCACRRTPLIAVLAALHIHPRAPPPTLPFLTTASAFHCFAAALCQPCISRHSLLFCSLFSSRQSWGL